MRLRAAALALLLAACRSKPPEPPAPSAVPVAPPAVDAGPSVPEPIGDADADKMVQVRIGGVVLDRGKPVPSAEVAIGDDVTVNTDWEGHFEATVTVNTDASNGEVDVEVTEGERFGSWAVFGGKDRLDLRIELAPTVPLRVHVVDSSGRPVAKAAIEASSELGADDERQVDRPAQMVVTAETNARGDASLRVRPDRFDVSANWSEGPEELREGVEVSDAGATLELRVGRYSVTGKVVTRAGRPVPGAVVVIDRRGDFAGDQERCDDDGVFHFSELPPGPYQLRVLSSNAGAGSAKVTAPTRGARIVVQSDSGIEGKVVDDKGQPLSDCWVKASLEDTDLAEVTSAKDGTFDFVAGPGTYDVAANCEGMLEASGEVTVLPHQHPRFTLVIKNAGSVSGYVVDVDGARVPGVSITAMKGDHGSGADSSPKGTFKVGPLSPGHYTLVVDDDDWLMVRPVSANAGDAEVKVVVARRPVLQGRVLNAAGTPVTHFKLCGDEVDSPDGRFSISVQDPPRELLYVEAGALGDASFVMPPAARYGPTALGDLQVSPARLVISVTDALHRPLPDVRVHFMRAGAEVAAFPGGDLWDPRTDANGQLQTPRIVGAGVSVVAKVAGAKDLVRPLESNAATVRLTAGPGQLLH